jgi:hypothetical protein
MLDTGSWSREAKKCSITGGAGVLLLLGSSGVPSGVPSGVLASGVVLPREEPRRTLASATSRFSLNPPYCQLAIGTKKTKENRKKKKRKMPLRFL